MSDATELSSPPRSSAIPTHLALGALLLFFGLVFHQLLFMSDGVFEHDGFYHARYSQLLPERGLSREFPWMQFTAWKDHFADKDFIYHLVMTPFCTDAKEPLPGAKIATILFALLAGLSLYVVLRQLKVPWPILFVALLLTGSGMFLNRLLMVRSHVLSITLMIWAAYFIIQRRTWVCCALAFLYAWTYSFPAAMLITAVAAEAGWMLHQRRLALPKISLAVGLGLAAGLLIHPYSPETIRMQLLLFTIASTGVSQSAVELGSEFQRLDFSDLVFALPGISLALMAAMAGGAAISMKKSAGKGLSAESCMALCAAVAWCGAMFIFSRLIEYAAPLAVLAAALVFRDGVGEKLRAPFNSLAQNARLRVLGAMGLAALLLAGSFYWAQLQVYATFHSSRNFYAGKTRDAQEAAWQRGRYFDGAADWLRRNAPTKSVVLNFHWDDFPELFYTAPEFYYIVGLDPTLLRLQSPEKSALLEAMRTGQTPLDFDKLHEAFGAEFLIMRNYRAAQYAPLKRGDMKPVFSDEGAVIYRIGGEARKE